MSKETEVTCDNRVCKEFRRLIGTNTRDMRGWISVRKMSDERNNYATDRHFCSLRCLINFLMNGGQLE